MRPKKITSVLEYNDDLTDRELAHLESIFAKECKKCETIKVPQSHHCSTCNACVARMDHHCPWVNNCVGYYNQKHFILFLIYVFLGSAHAMVLIGTQAYGCFNENCFMFVQGTTIFFCGVTMFLGILFMIFVCVMFYDQISCILENMSTIDKLKYKRAIKEGKKADIDQRSRTYWESICEVMSGRHDKGFDIWWLLPTDIEYPLCAENEYR